MNTTIVEGAKSNIQKLNECHCVAKSCTVSPMALPRTHNTMLQMDVLISRLLRLYCLSALTNLAVQLLTILSSHNNQCGLRTVKVLSVFGPNTTLNMTSLDSLLLAEQ